jgi:predicted DNA-binding ribbon-helix-helix protein
MRLESSLWEALEEIARREGGSVNDLCGRIDARRGDMSLTGAVRAALVSYYREELETVESHVHKDSGAERRSAV